jgi:hypothetical protein
MRISLSDFFAAPDSTNPDRRRFIGRPDARILMSADESALVRLLREKRGDIEPEDLSRNPVSSSSGGCRRT